MGGRSGLEGGAGSRRGGTYDPFYPTNRAQQQQEGGSKEVVRAGLNQDQSCILPFLLFYSLIFAILLIYTAIVGYTCAN